MRDTGYFRVIVGMIGLFFLMVSGTPSFAQTKDPIKIGVIANMGWPVGKSAAQAVQLGLKKLMTKGDYWGDPSN